MSEVQLEVNEEAVMLTTIDNPYNPKTDYDNWKQWDEDNGYYTEQYMARLMDEDVDIDDDLAVLNATKKVILDILDNDVLDIYVLV